MVEFSAETLKLGKATPGRFGRLLARELKVLGRLDLKTSYRGKDGAGNPILYDIRKRKPALQTTIENMGTAIA